LADVATDAQNSAPLLTVTINRDAAARFGIQPQLIDSTLNEAFGQDQVTQYFTNNSYYLILEVLPELQGRLQTLNELYIKAPSNGQLVPLSTLVRIDTAHIGPLLVSHSGQFPAVTVTFNLPPGVALGQAVDAITRAAAEIGMPQSLIGIVKKNGIMLVDFAINRERAGLPPREAIRQACLLRFRPIVMTTMTALLSGVALMVGHGAGSELRQPLGYSMVGGLALSQILTL